MLLTCEVRDSLGRPLPGFTFDNLGNQRAADTALAKHVLYVLRKAGCWAAASVHFFADGRDVGNWSMPGRESLPDFDHRR
jgi:hypothetical protein